VNLKQLQSLEESVQALTAITAVARKMLVSIYHVLKRHEEYHGQRDELLERKINRLQRTVDSSLQAE
jgi:Na+/phosphate symporter